MLFSPKTKLCLGRSMVHKNAWLISAKQELFLYQTYSGTVVLLPVLLTPSLTPHWMWDPPSLSPGLSLWPRTPEAVPTMMDDHEWLWLRISCLCVGHSCHIKRGSMIDLYAKFVDINRMKERRSPFYVLRNDGREVALKSTKVYLSSCFNTSSWVFIQFMTCWYWC